LRNECSLTLKNYFELNAHAAENISCESDGKPNIPSCECGIEELCIWNAIHNFNCLNTPSIHASGFQNIPNQLAQACLSWELNELEWSELLNDRTWNAVLKPSNFLQIYNSYLAKHENCGEFRIVSFESGFRNLFERKVEEVRDKTNFKRYIIRS